MCEFCRAANDPSVLTITEKAPTRAFYRLKAPTSTLVGAFSMIVQTDAALEFLVVAWQESTENTLIVYSHMTRMSQWSSIVLPGMFLLYARHESRLRLSVSPDNITTSASDISSN